MEKRKTKTIKLEIYEDREMEFRALVWLLKSNLTESGIDMIRNFYKDPSIFENHVREYADFIRDFISMIYIPSIDGDASIPSVALPAVFDEQMSNERVENQLIENIRRAAFTTIPDVYEELSAEDEAIQKELDEMIGADSEFKYVESAEETKIKKEVVEFINRSMIIPKLLGDDRQNDLRKFVVHQIKTREIQHFQTDEFWEAAWGYSRQSRLIDTDIKRIIFSPFSFRYGSNVVFQEGAIYSLKELRTMEKYRLAGDIYQHMEFWFPELSIFCTGNDYQLRLMTGLILSYIKKDGKKSLLLNEDDFLAKPNVKSKKTWRDYLAEYTLNWLVKANELGFEKYPTKREKGDFHK